MQYVQYVP